MLPILLFASSLLLIATSASLGLTSYDDDIIILNATAVVNKFGVCSSTICIFNEQASSMDCSGLGCLSWSYGDDHASTLTAAHLSVSRNRLVSLMTLQPFGTALQTLNASHFFLSDGLVGVDLSNNRLKSDAFQHPTSMMTFFGLTALLRLNLSDNELDELSEVDMFSSMRTTLEELDLSGNKIAVVADNVLTDMVTLTTLDLSRNRIRALSHRNFLGLINLRRLDLSYNHLGELPNELFGQCGRLEVLDLRHNAVRVVSPETFRGLHSLINLHLDDNELPDGVSAVLPLSLRRLTLDDSAALTHVNRRTLGGETALGMPPSSLEFISIRRCPSLITIGPGVFGRMKKLAVVQITDNPRLIVIDSAAFKEGNAQENPTVDDENDGKKLPSPIASGMVLNLSGNALSEISESLINWSTLTAFDLSFNLWICDCRLEWLQKLDFSTNQSFGTITCRWPLHLRGQRFTTASVRSATFSCDLTFVFRYQSGIVLIVGLTVLFLAASFMLVFRCRRTLVVALPCRWPTSDQDADYLTLFDASRATLSLQRASRLATEPIRVAATEFEPDDGGDGITKTIVTSSDPDPVQRPLISLGPAGTRRSAIFIRKQRN